MVELQARHMSLFYPQRRERLESVGLYAKSSAALQQPLPQPYAAIGRYV